MSWSTLVDVLERSVAHHAERPVRGEARGAVREVSYRAFGLLVDQVRAGLQALGVVRAIAWASIANNRLDGRPSPTPAMAWARRWCPCTNRSTRRNGPHRPGRWVQAAVHRQPGHPRQGAGCPAASPAWNRWCCSKSGGHGHHRSVHLPLSTADRGSAAAARCPPGGNAPDVACLMYTLAHTGDPRGWCCRTRHLLQPGGPVPGHPPGHRAADAVVLPGPTPRAHRRAAHDLASGPPPPSPRGWTGWCRLPRGAAHGAGGGAPGFLKIYAAAWKS